MLRCNEPRLPKAASVQRHEKTLFREFDLPAREYAKLTSTSEIKNHRYIAGGTTERK